MDQTEALLQVGHVKYVVIDQDALLFEDEKRDHADESDSNSDNRRQETSKLHPWVNEIRDIDQVHLFLQKHFIELSWFKIVYLYFVNPLSVLFNVVYIIYTWLSYTISNNSDEKSDLRSYQSMVNWMEFLVLLFMIFMFFYSKI